MSQYFIIEHPHHGVYVGHRASTQIKGAPMVPSFTWFRHADAIRYATKAEAQAVIDKHKSTKHNFRINSCTVKEIK